MKKNLFLALAALVLLLAAPPAAEAEGPPLGGWFEDGYLSADGSLPGVSFTEITAGGEEREVGLVDWRGKVVLVNFWATWCAPCVREMPELDSLQAALGGEDFQVVVISNDRGGLRQVEPFYREQGLENLGIWLDPRGELARALGVRGLPTSFVIDRDGRVVGRTEGAAPWDGEDALALFRWYIDSPN